MKWFDYYEGKIDAFNHVINDLVDIYENNDKKDESIKLLIDSYLCFKEYLEKERKKYER